MAEESNVHIKLAGAEVFGLFLISMIAILVGMFGLGVFDDYGTGTMSLGVILGTAEIFGWGLILCTVVAYLNENLLVSAAFGLFGIFLILFSPMAGAFLLGESMQAEVLTIFFGIGIAVIGLVALAQPVKILPIFLFIAALALICLGLWFDMGDDIKMVVGILWTIASLLALYMAAGIAFLTVKGKMVLPLLVKA
jgi:hypothetical protein